MKSILEKDNAFVWHPFTQMQTAPPPIPVVRAEGAWLFDESGKGYLDLNSSWWTNIHGHGHSYLAEKIYEQFLKIDHVIFAGVTHPQAVELSERILKLLKGNFEKVFFSDNGSTSVEVAIKMVYQYGFNRNESKKRFLALEGAYHGDTFGAMSVGQRGYFNKPFEHLFFQVDFVTFPNAKDEKSVLEKIEELFKSGEFAGFIFEPLVQGAAGMRMYSPEFLNEALKLARKYDVLTIADEVMTGFYRTGSFFAIHQLTEQPDIICLSKGLTGGVLPLGLTVTTHNIFEAFLSDDTSKALLHGHSFTGNALSCAAACASLDLLEQTQTLESVKRISALHQEFVKANQHEKFVDQLSSQGTILSLKLKTDAGDTYFQSLRDRAYRYFVERGFLIRPLGPVIFINPPYCISSEDLKRGYDVVLDFCREEFES